MHLVQKIDFINSPLSKSPCSPVLSKPAEITLSNTTLKFFHTTYLTAILYVEIALIGEWKGELVNFKLSEKEIGNISSFSNTSHTVGFCNVEEKIDRKLGFSFKISDYEQILELSASSNLPFQITSLFAVTFDVCQNNSEPVDGKCACKIGFYKEFTNLDISNCTMTGYSSTFCYKCSECPPLCSSCKKNPNIDLNIICLSCINNPNISLQNDLCTSINSKK